MNIQKTDYLSRILKYRLGISQSEIETICKKWKIKEMALFGSVLRDDFSDDSDVDVLLVFTPQHGWNLFDLMDLKSELQSLFNREVDLLQKKELRNPFRREEILKTHRIIYEQC